MNKPNREQAEAAFSVIDRALSGMDCRGLSLVQARDLIAAMQLMAQYVQAEAPAVAAEATKA